MSDLTFVSDGDSFDYRGVTVEIVRDECAENPWAEIEYTGLPPIMVHSAGNFHYDKYECSRDNLESPFDYFSDGQISRHWREIARLLDLPESDVEAEARETVKEWGGTLAEARREIFERTIQEMGDCRPSWNIARDYFDTLEALFNLVKIRAERFTRSGYCQGHAVHILVVATPEFLERVGLKNAKKEPLESHADLYAAWAYGDAFGYVIDDSDIADSCFGFYGVNAEKSGLAEQARETIDRHTERAKRDRVNRIKTMIRNRVPLHVRADELGVDRAHSFA